MEFRGIRGYEFHAMEIRQSQERLLEYMRGSIKSAFRFKFQVEEVSSFSTKLSLLNIAVTL